MMLKRKIVSSEKMEKRLERYGSSHFDYYLMKYDDYRQKDIPIAEIFFEDVEFENSHNMILTIDIPFD